MPGHAKSPYWATVDFDSEGDEEQTIPHNNRIYLDPWDNEAYGVIQTEAVESSQGDNFHSFVGEPVSASFYYVPTKNYGSEEDTQLPRNNLTPPVDILAPEYSIYGRKISRTGAHLYHLDTPIYERPIRDRRRSMYIDEPVYAPHPLIYEALYGGLPPPPLPGYLPGPPRPRLSTPHHPEYMIANMCYGKNRRHSRLTDAYEHFAYETLSPEYEDWARPFPKTAPDNFHLSRYGHLQIDYSCSWNSLDRLIRNS